MLSMPLSPTNAVDEKEIIHSQASCYPILQKYQARKYSSQEEDTMKVESLDNPMKCSPVLACSDASPIIHQIFERKTRCHDIALQHQQKHRRKHLHARYPQVRYARYLNMCRCGCYRRGESSTSEVTSNQTKSKQCTTF